jgi:hypothetical protein
MLRGAADEARRLVSAGGDVGAQDLSVVLDRITAVGALGLELQRHLYFSLSVQTLLDLYGWPIADLRVQTTDHELVPALWLRIAEHLNALGALAVRVNNWTAVRELTLCAGPGAPARITRANMAPRRPYAGFSCPLL